MRYRQNLNRTRFYHEDTGDKYVAEHFTWCIWCTGYDAPTPKSLKKERKKKASKVYTGSFIDGMSLLSLIQLISCLALIWAYVCVCALFESCVITEMRRGTTTVEKKKQKNNTRTILMPLVVCRGWWCRKLNKCMSRLN